MYDIIVYVNKYRYVTVSKYFFSIYESNSIDFSSPFVVCFVGSLTVHLQTFFRQAERCGHRSSRRVLPG